jgi:hypothetical protein
LPLEKVTVHTSHAWTTFEGEGWSFRFREADDEDDEAAADADAALAGRVPLEDDEETDGCGNGAVLGP